MTAAAKVAKVAPKRPCTLKIPVVLSVILLLVRLSSPGANAVGKDEM
jgi:hypothetical protein